MAFDPQSIYYGVDGERYGPVDLAELRALLASGRVRPDDYVWDEDRDDWVALRRYPAIFDPSLVEAGTDPAGVRYEFEPVDEGHPSVWRVRTDLPYASVGLRFLAWVIDDVVLLLPAFLWVLSVESRTGLDLVAVWEELGRSGTLHGAEQAFMQQVQLGVLLIRGLYWTLMESSRWQATVGKRFTGLVVCDDRGYRISLGRALVRYAGRLFCEFTFGLGYLLILFTRRHQGLHDAVARTIVVRGR